MTESPPDWDIPSSWGAALQAARDGGTLLLLGGVDSGKSTLAAILASAACQAGRATAVVDADVGQSSIGPPTCVGMAPVGAPINDLEELEPHAIDFVGSPSPAGHLLQCAVSTGVMAAAARRGGAEAVIVDTTGLISGSAARALKSAKIRLLEAQVVVALQSADEVEHLVAPFACRSRPQILRLPQSRRAKPRSRLERASRRQRKFAAYFADARTFEVCWDSLPIENTPWTTGESLPGHLASYAEELVSCEVLHAERCADGVFLIVTGRPDREGLRSLGEGFGGSAQACEVGCLDHRLVGLLGGRGETLALGLLDNIDFSSRRLSILTPLSDTAPVCGLRLGAVQVGRDGTQLGWNEVGERG